MPANPKKQLRRLPQVFSQILVLPLRSNADVLIKDRSDCFMFIADIEGNAFSGHVIRAHALKIHPEVTKVVIRCENGKGLLLDTHRMSVDKWRCRLSETTRPELATAVVVGRKLTVTVPKGGRPGSYGGGKVEDGGNRGRLILIH